MDQWDTLLELLRESFLNGLHEGCVLVIFDHGLDYLQEGDSLVILLAFRYVDFLDIGSPYLIV